MYISNDDLDLIEGKGTTQVSGIMASTLGVDGTLPRWDIVIATFGKCSTLVHWEGGLTKAVDIRRPRISDWDNRPGDMGR